MINRLIALFRNVKAQWAYRIAVNETINELNKLTNHELHDIGISRGEIRSIAIHSHTAPKKVTAKDIAVENENLKGWV